MSKYNCARLQINYLRWALGDVLSPVSHVSSHFGDEGVDSLSDIVNFNCGHHFKYCNNRPSPSLAVRMSHPSILDCAVDYSSPCTAILVDPTFFISTFITRCSTPQPQSVPPDCVVTVASPEPSASCKGADVTMLSQEPPPPPSKKNILRAVMSGQPSLPSLRSPLGTLSPRCLLPVCSAGRLLRGANSPSLL